MAVFLASDRASRWLPSAETCEPANGIAPAWADLVHWLPDHSERALEIGGSKGATIAWLKSLGRCAQTFSVDLRPDAPDTRAGHADAALHVDLVQRLASMAACRPFDLVLWLEGFEGAGDLRVRVDRAASLLSAGGLLIASVPATLRGRSVSRAAARDLFARPSLQPLACRVSDPRGGVAKRWLTALSSGRLPGGRSSHYLIAARRP